MAWYDRDDAERRAQLMGLAGQARGIYASLHTEFACASRGTLLGCLTTSGAPLDERELARELGWRYRDFKAHFDSLCARGLVDLREVGGRVYFWLPGFGREQTRCRKRVARAAGVTANVDLAENAVVGAQGVNGDESGHGVDRVVLGEFAANYRVAASVDVGTQRVTVDESGQCPPERSNSGVSGSMPATSDLAASVDVGAQGVTVDESGQCHPGRASGLARVRAETEIGTGTENMKPTRAYACDPPGPHGASAPPAPAAVFDAGTSVPGVLTEPETETERPFPRNSTFAHAAGATAPVAIGEVLPGTGIETGIFRDGVGHGHAAGAGGAEAPWGPLKVQSVVRQILELTGDHGNRRQWEIVVESLGATGAGQEIVRASYAQTVARVQDARATPIQNRGKWLTRVMENHARKAGLMWPLRGGRS